MFRNGNEDNDRKLVSSAKPAYVHNVGIGTHQASET
jgi:hypothetical protein